jgi:hypothetical protein
MPKKIVEEDYKIEQDRILVAITEAAQGVTEWLDNANCGDLDTNDFFLDKSTGVSDDILKLCLGCTVRKECIEMIGSFELFDKRYGKGVFAGMSGNARATHILPYPKEEWEQRSADYIEHKLLIRSRDYANKKKRERNARAKERIKNAQVQ